MTLPPCYVPLDDEDSPFEPTRRGFLIGSAVVTASAFVTPLLSEEPKPVKDENAVKFALDING
ncbi:MAG TPA: twin-arginine translocation signal domain-containing protein, partial [Thermoanaerobaculia bacterium]|nr:twin-arginine translocation signal domain-containing protein [Thermoanaerobaculia bacterium]